VAQFAYDGSQLLTIFEIKLNGADFFFFSKLVLSPESPGNRPHPHYCLISLALTNTVRKTEVTIGSRIGN
ncbi:TPA: hypothetical protein ACNBO9_005482, partial [Escherichia coli]